MRDDSSHDLPRAFNNSIRATHQTEFDDCGAKEPRTSETISLLEHSYSIAARRGHYCILQYTYKGCDGARDGGGGGHTAVLPRYRLLLKALVAACGSDNCAFPMKMKLCLRRRGSAAGLIRWARSSGKSNVLGLRVFAPSRCRNGGGFVWLCRKS